MSYSHSKKGKSRSSNHHHEHDHISSMPIQSCSNTGNMVIGGGNDVHNINASLSTSGVSSSSSGSRQNSRSNKHQVSQYDGVYNNSRLMHITTSLIGCSVQIRVKNGSLYEGILKTFSSKMELALECVHACGKDNAFGTVPHRDKLIPTMIFNPQDIVSMLVPDVDLDYANKDCFTDSAIGKANGQVTGEKQLEAWDSEGYDGLGDALTSTDKSNGWDPNEMFKINEDKFNVTSSYDSSLSEYTTPIKREDTQEYRNKEKLAAKMAKEIEGTEGYQNNLELENGDGDEESKWSAVTRTCVAPVPRKNSNTRRTSENKKHVPTTQPNAEVVEESNISSIDVAEVDRKLSFTDNEPATTSPPPKALKSQSQSQVLADLKNFHGNFNLDSSDKKSAASKSPISKTVPIPKGSPKKEDSSTEEKTKKFSLNPNAPEFKLNPNAKPFAPQVPITTGIKHPMPSATPPRPATNQSPINLMPQPPPQSMIMPSYIVPTSAMIASSAGQQQQQQQRMQKRAVNVNNRPNDFNQAAIAAAGAPIVANPALTSPQTPPMNVPYFPLLPIHGNHQRLVQPGTNVAEQQMSHQQQHQIAQQQAAAQQAAQQAVQVFVTTGGMMTAQNHHHAHHHPAHIAPHHQQNPSHCGQPLHPTPSPQQNQHHTSTPTPAMSIMAGPSNVMTGPPPQQPATPTSPQTFMHSNFTQYHHQSPHHAQQSPYFMISGNSPMQQVQQMQAIQASMPAHHMNHMPNPQAIHQMQYFPQMAHAAVNANGQAGPTMQAFPHNQ